MFALRLVLGLLPLIAQAAELPAVQTVATVDLQRYLGKWQEIASYPMFFQRHCLGDTSAEYRLLTDGRIGVTNRCRSEDGLVEAEGKASVVPDSGGARLKVSFFWPFSGDYWIIGLDADYRWAVVGDPRRKYLWILARTVPMPENDWLAAIRAAEKQGYDPAGLRRTTHSNIRGE